MSTVTAVAAAEPDPPRRSLTPAEPDWPDDTAPTFPPQAAAILHTIAALLGYGQHCEPTSQPHRRDTPAGAAPQLSAFQLHEHAGQSALLLKLSDGTTWRLIAEPVQP